jgi:hypothetical protein
VVFFLKKKKKKTNICDENISDENISLLDLQSYNLFGVMEVFQNIINKELAKINLEHFKNYKNIAIDLYKVNKIDLDYLYQEFYDIYVKKTKSKILKSSFFSLMKNYYEIIILFNITERIKNLLFLYNHTRYNNVNKDKRLLLTNYDQEQYPKLEIILNKDIKAFINLQYINCNIVKTYLKNFTFYLEKFLDMYNRIKRYNKVSTPNPNLESESELFTKKEYNRLYKQISDKLDLENLQDKLQQKIIKNLKDIRSRKFNNRILLNVNENINTKKNLNYLFNNFTDEEKKDLLKLNGQAFVNKFVELKVSHMPQQSSGRNSGLSSRRNSGLSSGPSSRPNSVLSSGLSSQPSSSIRLRLKGFPKNKTKRQGLIF